MAEERPDRVGLVVRIAGWLFVTAAVCGYFFLDWRLFPGFGSYAIMLGPPASATLIYVALGLAVRELHAPAKLTFPLTVTGPIVYVLLTRVAVILWASPNGPGFKTPEALAPAQVWSDPLRLGILALAQILLLSVAARFPRSGPV